MLLARQIGAFSIDSQGSTPIHLAAWAGHSEIVELLIQSSADGAVNIKVMTSTPKSFRDVFEA